MGCRADLVPDPGDRDRQARHGTTTTQSANITTDWRLNERRGCVGGRVPLRYRRRVRAGGRGPMALGSRPTAGHSSRRPAAVRHLALPDAGPRLPIGESLGRDAPVHPWLDEIRELVRSADASSRSPTARHYGRSGSSSRGSTRRPHSGSALRTAASCTTDPTYSTTTRHRTTWTDSCNQLM
jgi:hypothetical protein